MLRPILRRSRKCPRRGACPRPLRCSVKESLAISGRASCPTDDTFSTARSRRGQVWEGRFTWDRSTRPNGKCCSTLIQPMPLYTQGYLLFLRETTLIAQPFDARRLVLTGDAFPIAERIRTSTSTQPYGYFSASENGALAYQTGAETANSQLLWFDRTGKQIGELGDPAAYSCPGAFSRRQAGFRQHFR